MPMHDWTRVEAGIFHAFHHEWVSEIGRALNRGLLPADYYALPEQVAAGFGPDVLTLQEDREAGADRGGTATALRPRPVAKVTAQTDAEFYRRKKSAIAVRHVTGDRIVAVVEIVSPGNKASRHAVRAFRDKACELLEHRVHLLIVDPFPPGPRDPGGVHGLIWEEVSDEPYRLPPDRPLAVVAYEADLITRAYVVPVAVGAPLPDGELFLEPDGCVLVPLEATYQTAFDALPRRWGDELNRPAAD